MTAEVLYVEEPELVIEQLDGARELLEVGGTTELLEIAEQGPPGPGGEATGLVTLLSTAVVGAHRVIWFDDTGTIQLADSSNTASQERVFGITQVAANIGDTLTVRRLGAMTDSSFAFTPGKPVYFNASGVLTQTVPTAGYMQEVALCSADPQTIFVGLGLAISLV